MVFPEKRVHEPRGTVVQMRTKADYVELDLAALGPETTAKGGISDRRIEYRCPIYRRQVCRKLLTGRLGMT
jgi:hypothetical protein